MRFSVWRIFLLSSPRQRSELMKVWVLWTTKALDDNFSVVSLDNNSIHFNSIPGHILHAERVWMLGTDLLNANSYCSLSFTASSPSTLSLRKVPISHLKIEVFRYLSRTANVKKRFEVHVCTAGPRSRSKLFTARFFAPQNTTALRLRGTAAV